MEEKLVANCFNESATNVIVVIENTTDDDLILKILYSSLIPVNVFATHGSYAFRARERYRSYILDEMHHSNKNDPATSILIVASSDSILAMVLEDMRNSIWWNHEGRFLVVNKDVNNGCRIARLSLSTIWAFNVLSAIYLCYNHLRQLILYTFNPYTNLAPEFWSEVLGSMNWTLLLHAFEAPLTAETLSAHSKYIRLFHVCSNSSIYDYCILYDGFFERCTVFGSNELDQFICHSIYFDKVRNLNGYNLKAFYSRDSRFIDYTPTINHAGCSYGEPGIMCTVLNHINAGVTTTIVDDYFLDEQGEPQGPLKDVLTGIIDFTIHTYFLSGFYKEQLYPFDADCIRIISAKDTAKNFNIVMHGFSLKVWLFFIVSSAVCVVILKYALEQSVSTAALEFVRMILSASTLEEPRKLYGQILLITLVIACFAMNTFLMSYLSAMVTVSEHSPTIDTVDDLINSNLSIYGSEELLNYMLREEIRDHYRVTEEFTECLDRLFAGERLVCIRETGILGFYVYENATIHISKHALISIPYTNVMSEDSPLRIKFT